MYDMYPEGWSAKQTDQRAGDDDDKAPQPRRRARKEHQVAPQVLRISTRSLSR